MKTLQRRLIWLLMLLAYSGMSVKAPAEVVIDWVDVGDPGNPESPVLKRDGSSGYGAVDYKFRMGKYEVTNFQYTEFLNSVAETDTNDLFETRMELRLWGGIARTGSSGSYTYSVKANMGNKPVNFVSWFDSARFANWFHNGQPIGMQSALTTEDGAYTFSGPETVSTRHAGAQFFIPNEHEWDKTGFYEPGAVTSFGDGWWNYTSRSDIPPSVSATADATGTVSNPGPTIVNYRKTANWNGSVIGNVTTVGSAENESYYGASDMSGNVFEWVTADPSKPDPNGWGPYTVRGGSFIQFGHVDVRERNLVHHSNHAFVDRTVGFRLAAAFVGPDSADFNNDTFVNGEDLELWEQAYGNSIAGDADNDGISSGKDFLIWQQQFTQPDSADFNNDTFVNGDDLELWEQAYGNSIAGDADNDGISDGRDFLIWQQQLTGATSFAAATQVPEPTGIALAIAVGLSLAGSRSWGRRTDKFLTSPTTGP